MFLCDRLNQPTKHYYCQNLSKILMVGMAASGRQPTKNVHVRASVKDAKGRNFSTKFGNIIDPSDIVDGRSFKSMKEGIENSLHVNPDEKNVGNKKSQMSFVEQNFGDGIEKSGSDALRMSLMKINTAREKYLETEDYQDSVKQIDTVRFFKEMTGIGSK